MHEFEREYHVARLIAGGPSFIHKGVRYRMGVPSREARLEAAEVQLSAYRSGMLEGLKTQDDLVCELIMRGLWSREGDDRLEELRFALDDAKADLYRDKDRESFALRHRETIAAIKSEMGSLEARRRKLDAHSLETYARSAGARYSAGTSLLQIDGTPYWTDRMEGWASADDVVEAAMRRTLADRLGVSELRELARSDEWQQVWNARTGEESPFGVPAADLGDEQRILVGWSRLYEGVAQRQDAPPRDAFDDDDLFDGWLILERRKRSNDDLEARFRREVGDKVANMQEVFMVMDPDAKKGTLRSSPALLANLNDPEAQKRKAERLAYIKQRGMVHEQEMPDTNRQIQMDLAASPFAMKR